MAPGAGEPLFYRLASNEFENPIIEGMCAASQGPINYPSARSTM